MQYDYESETAKEYRLREEAGNKLIEKFELKFTPGISSMISNLFGEKKTYKCANGDKLYESLSNPMQRKLDGMIVDAQTRKRFLDELVEIANSGYEIKQDHEKSIRFGGEWGYKTVRYDASAINWGGTLASSVVSEPTQLEPASDRQPNIESENENLQIKILKVLIELEKYSNRALIEQNSTVIKQLFKNFTDLKISEHRHEISESILLNILSRLKNLQNTINTYLQGDDEVHNFSTILTNMIQTIEGLTQTDVFEDLIATGRMKLG